MGQAPPGTPALLAVFAFEAALFSRVSARRSAWAYFPWADHVLYPGRASDACGQTRLCGFARAAWSSATGTVS